MEGEGDGYFFPERTVKRKELAMWLVRAFRLRFVVDEDYRYPPPSLTVSAQPTSGTAPLTVRFESQSSTSSGGPAAQVVWYFGDGDGVAQPASLHTYDEPGVYTCEVYAFDEQLSTTMRTVTIQVFEPEPPLEQDLSEPVDSVDGDWLEPADPEVGDRAEVLDTGDGDTNAVDGDTNGVDGDTNGVDGDTNGVDGDTNGVDGNPDVDLDVPVEEEQGQEPWPVLVDTCGCHTELAPPLTHPFAWFLLGFWLLSHHHGYRSRRRAHFSPVAVKSRQTLHDSRRLRAYASREFVQITRLILKRR